MIMGSGAPGRRIGDLPPNGQSTTMSVWGPFDWPLFGPFRKTDRSIGDKARFRVTISRQSVFAHAPRLQLTSQRKGTRCR